MRKKKSTKCNALSDCGGMYGWIRLGVDGRDECGRSPAVELKASRRRKATTSAVSIEVSRVFETERTSEGEAYPHGEDVGLCGFVFDSV